MATYYIVSLSPLNNVKVNGIFDAGSSSPSRVLEKPESLRYSGWNLETFDQARIVAGEFLEVADGDRKTIRLFEDGTLLVRGLVNEDFLAWGTRDKTFDDDPRVHSLAITEFTLSIVYLYRRLVSFMSPQPSELEYFLQIDNAPIGTNPLYITPFKVNTIGWLTNNKKYSIQSNSVKKEGTLSVKELVDDPDHASYEVVKSFFLLFGVAANAIPYVSEIEGVRRVNVNEIKELH